MDKTLLTLSECHCSPVLTDICQSPTFATLTHTAQTKRTPNRDTENKQPKLPYHHSALSSPSHTFFAPYKILMVHKKTLANLPIIFLRQSFSPHYAKSRKCTFPHFFLTLHIPPANFANQTSPEIYTGHHTKNKPLTVNSKVLFHPPLHILSPKFPEA